MTTLHRPIVSRVLPSIPAARRFTLAIADDADRAAIYKLRHEVYAAELHQHHTNDTGELRDSLDAVNLFIVAKLGDRVIGCVSVTPPAPGALGGVGGAEGAEGAGGAGRFSLEKYVDRAALPFAFDATVFEARLLTVAQPFRRGPTAALLMYAALRWIESRGGKRIVGIGRREVMGLYKKVGLTPAGITVTSGAVTYDVMHATTEACHHALAPLHDALERLGDSIEWRLDMPFKPDDGCYHGGAFFEAIGDEFDDLSRRDSIINADVLDAWFPPSPRVTAALTEHLPWLLRTSPPTGAEGMARAIARARGVEPANILCGAGSSDLIYLALRHWLTPQSRALILDPMYGEYAHVLEKVIGCTVDRLTLPRHNGYALDPSRLVEAATRHTYDLIAIVNPNSPTGRFVERDALLTALEQIAPHTRVWIDETYIEYAGETQSLETFAVTTPNIVVCKSMSKVYALSGVRAAYLCGSAATMQPLRRISPPWAVSLPAQVAAVTALKGADYYAAKHEETRKLRDALAAAITSITTPHGPITPLPGVGNFVLCELPENGPTAGEIVKRCRTRGVYLRDVGNMGAALGTHALRIAVKSAAENERIIAALREAVSRG